MAAESEVTTLADENSHEVKGHSKSDRARAIVKKLYAISVSVPFHSDFFRYLTKGRSLDAKKDESSDWVDDKTSEADTKERKHQTVKFSAGIKGDEIETSGDAEHSSGGIGQRPAEIAAGDVNSVLDSPGAQSELAEPTTRNSETEDDSDDDCLTEDESEKLTNVQYCYSFNLLSTIFLANRKLIKAKMIIENVLLVAPDNFNALWNKVRLMVAMAKESGNCIDERAEEILDQLEQTVSHNKKQMLIAKAETAAMYSHIFPVTSDTLIRCIRLYREVLAEEDLANANEHEDSLPENLVDFWKCDLVGTYAKLTNANKELLAKYGFHHGEVLSRLEDLVLAVDSSDHIANKLKAQTWVNLANTFEHFKQNYPTERFRQDIFDGQLSLADCFANASALDPDNSRILMRTGRELRQRSTSERDLREAIRFFEKALNGVNVDDIRDIIYHHMGLTYRSLWRLIESPVPDCTIDDYYQSARAGRPFGCRVIKPPDQPLDFELIPPPYKWPPKAAFWKILNPIARDPDSPYLLKARQCFEEASRLDKDNDELSDSLYLMEIARTHLSAGNVEKAREYLVKAEEQPNSDIIDVDFVGNSLYENIGLLEESELIKKDFNEVDAEKVKSFYRESIRLSTIAKNKPLVAFHYLLRILYKQLERCVDRYPAELDQMVIQHEYFLLYMAIQQADNGRYIVNSLATDDFRIALMWKLIEMFHQRDQQYDAAAAFTYLSILVMANKLTAEVKEIDLTVVEKQRMLIQSVERVAQQRVGQPRFLPEPYRQLLALREDGVLEDRSDSRNLLDALTDVEKQKLDIVMKIIQPGFSPGYTRLTEQCY